MDMNYQMIAALVLALVGGIGVGRLLGRGRLAQTLAEAQAQAAEQVAQANTQAAVKVAEAEVRLQQFDEIKREVERLRASEMQLATEIGSAKTALKAEQSHVTEKVALLEQAKEALANQFKALATQVLDEKTQKFSEQSEKDLGNLLNPLKVKLDEFRQRVDTVYGEDLKDRTALAEQVKNLAALNQTLSDDAKNLTNALKGDSKTQGNWGELVLETILEASGLRAGHEFVVQKSSNNAEGAARRPDVVIQLPGSRQLVVDSKVSLTAYEAMMSADSADDRQANLKEHLSSIGRHISGLSEKKYQTLYDLPSLDFVLMFIPLEPAFMTAISNDKDLFMKAWEKNVLLVSPSTLLFVVRTVAHLWRQEAQSRNAQDIAHRGAELYDKLALFTESMESLGDRLKQAQLSYDTACNRLSTGNGSVVRQAEMLIKLGVKPSKTLAKKFADSESGLPLLSGEQKIERLSQGEASASLPLLPDTP
jgi:DNA recombination protein RmuC